MTSDKCPFCGARKSVMTYICGSRGQLPSEFCKLTCCQRDLAAALARAEEKDAEIERLKAELTALRKLPANCVACLDVIGKQQFPRNT